MSFIPRDKDPGIFEVDTLSNGVKVFHRKGEQIFGLPKIASCVLVMAGGRDDPTGKEGSAHFFEHMPFRGTTHFPSLEALTYDIERNGGYINAFTTDEATGYEVITPSTMFEDGVIRIADMLMHPVMREKDIEIERDVILEELRNKLASVNFFARQQLYKGLLGDHPLVHAVIGTEEALRSVGKADLLAFHQQHYTAANTALFFVGTYDKDKLLQECETHFGKLSKGKATNRNVQVAPPKLEKTIQTFTPERYNRSVYLLGRTLPPASLRETFMIRIFIDMLTRGMTSPLYQEIRDKRGLAYNLHIDHSQYQDVNLLSFFVTTQYKHMDEVHRLFWQEVDLILHNEHRFKEIKHMMKQYALYRDYSIGSLLGIAIDMYLDDGKITPLNDIMTLLDSLSLQDVRDFLIPFLKPDDFLNIRVNCDTKMAAA